MNTENELVVHIFYPETQSQRDFHGKVLRPEIRFRGPPDDYPDTQMLLFHYQQCVIKCFPRLVGFSDVLRFGTYLFTSKFIRM